ALERARLLEQVRRAWDDLEPALDREQIEHLAVRLQHDPVSLADDHQRRRPDVGEGARREVDTAAAGDDGADAFRPLGGGGGLWRLLPLPCAKRTTPAGSTGIVSVPSSATPSAGTTTVLSWSAACMALGPSQQLADLVVRDLREALVPDPDCEERLRHAGADDIVGLAPQLLDTLRRRDGAGR